jgi:predicted pore-forming effector associated with SMODS systems
MTGTPRSSRPVPDGQSAQITRRQDQPEHLQRLLAYSRYYQVAHRWRRARTLGTFVLALAGPILAIFVPATSDLVAAISAGWLVLGRTLLTWLEQRTALEAVRVQELYDTSLFNLPWNAALVGRRPVPDDIAAAARHITNDIPFHGWYSIELGDTPWPADVLLCQRQSAIWSRRDHRSYGTAVLVAGVSWFLVGLAVALARDLSLADYLVKIFLPSAPAFLDSFELARQHWHHAAARTHVEDKIHDLWQTYTSEPTSLTVEACREIQDSVYLLRRDGPRVPSIFYKLRRANSEASTQAGTVALRTEGSRTAIRGRNFGP